MAKGLGTTEENMWDGWMNLLSAMSFCSSTPDTGVGSCDATLSGLKTPGRCQDVGLSWLFGDDSAAAAAAALAAAAVADRDDLEGLPPSAAAAAV